MTAEMATEVLQHLEGDYLVKVKFDREQTPGVWVAEDGFAPLKEGRAHGGKVLEISRITNPGALEGVDRLYFQNANPVTEVVYGLYPIRDPDPENLASMHTGDLNCVAQRVVEHFEGAQHGQGLTPARHQKIEAWV